MADSLKVESYDSLLRIAVTLSAEKLSELNQELKGVVSTRDGLDLKFRGLAATNYNKSVLAFELSFNSYKEKLKATADIIVDDVNQLRSIANTLASFNFNR